jgi:tellurite resistance protein TehA-like permease
MAALPIGTWGALQGALVFGSTETPGLVWCLVAFGLIAVSVLAILALRGRRRRKDDAR